MAKGDDLSSLLDKGAKLYAAGQSAAAAAIYRRAKKIAPENPTVRLRLALSIWHGENRGEEALSEIRRLAAVYPQAAVLGAEALVLNSMGRFEEAALAARLAVRDDPRHSSAWRDLATAIHADDAEALDAELAELLRAPDLTAAQRRDLHGARATALRKVGLLEEAFTQTECANGFAPRRWDLDREMKGMEEIRSVFSAALMQRLFATAPADRRMIFIIGMPRSGTTLLERMLASHPRIASAGETPIIGNLWTQFRKQAGTNPKALAAALSPEHLSAMAEAQRGGIATRIEGTPSRVIDKMPPNYLYLPLIRLMLPGATVIEMRRHPLDTCLSCLEANFAFGLDYASNQVTLGAAYRMYRALMDHWTGAVGISVHKVSYEDLVSAPEKVMPPLVKAIGLDWTADCLRPADGGLVKTASVAQARNRVDTGSVGRWQRFETRLQPLIEALGGMAAIEEMHAS